MHRQLQAFAHRGVLGDFLSHGIHGVRKFPVLVQNSVEVAILRDASVLKLPQDGALGANVAVFVMDEM